MLTLYGKRQSRAARCLWTLEELGLPYRHVPTDQVTGGTRTAEFLGLNPTGRIPVLVDGDFVLRESVAIGLHLVMNHASLLWPDDAAARARILQWTSWAITEMEPPFTRVIRERRRAAGAGGEPDAAMITEALADAATAMAPLEQALAGGADHLAAPAFTLGDINAATAAMVAPMFLDMAAFPASAAWLKSVLARPAWVRVQALA